MARTAVIVLILGVCLPEVLLAGVVLKAGEIDSSKVRVGAFAEVVYGKGARDPVSGKWEKLGRARGYIKAVDAEHLTLGRGLWKERIAFARIERLIIAESSREMARLRKTTDTLSVRTDSRNVRIGRKFAFGAVTGIFFIVGGHGVDKYIMGDEDGWVAPISYTVGVGVGVSSVDPHDRFLYSLTGSLIGVGAFIATAWLIEPSSYDYFVAMGAVALFVPPIGATAMSEVFRNPPEARRVSVGLAPSPKGSVSARATLRF